MATTLFMNVIKVSVEVHDFPEHNRSAIHFLIDSKTHQGATCHEEAVIQWLGSKEELLAALGITLPEKH
jgi:hypothetical protein